MGHSRPTLRENKISGPSWWTEKRYPCFEGKPTITSGHFIRAHALALKLWSPWRPSFSPKGSTRCPDGRLTSTTLCRVNSVIRRNQRHDHRRGNESLRSRLEVNVSVETIPRTHIRERKQQKNASMFPEHRTKQHLRIIPVRLR